MATPSTGGYTIPQQLQDMLLDFTVSFLVEQPDDVLDYAVDYFGRLQQNRNDTAAGKMTTTDRCGSGSICDQDMITDDDDDFDDDGPPIAYKSTGRRKSVFAETYDPEDDEAGANDIAAYHPKSEFQRQRLLDDVKAILIFRSLEEDQLSAVLDAMFEKHVVAGDVIIKQGDDGDNFYVVESGSYSIEVDGNIVGKIEDKGFFGELALMYNMPRAASITALSDGMLWAMDRVTFRRIILRNAFQKRKMYESFLESVSLLQQLAPYERMNLADALISQNFSDGSVIIQQGDPADGMYFVESGVVNISVVPLQGGGPEKIVSKIEKGGVFGELALVTHKPRAATAKADGAVRVAFLDVKAFERLLGPCMGVMKRNIDNYEEQLVQIFGSKNNISDIR